VGEKAKLIKSERQVQTMLRIPKYQREKDPKLVDLVTPPQDNGWLKAELPDDEIRRPKISVTLTLDLDVFTFFTGLPDKRSTAINRALRKYINEQGVKK